MEHLLSGRSAIQPGLDHVLYPGQKVILPIAGASAKLLVYSRSARCLIEIQLLFNSIELYGDS